MAIVCVVLFFIAFFRWVKVNLGRIFKYYRCSLLRDTAIDSSIDVLEA